MLDIRKTPCKHEFRNGDRESTWRELRMETRCHFCGKVIDADDAERVEDAVTVTGPWGFFMSQIEISRRYQLVDACPPCARKVHIKEREESREESSLSVFFMSVIKAVGIAVLVGAFLLILLLVLRR